MNPLSFSPFPVLETERLVLRRLEDSDKPEVSVLRSDERVNEYINRPKLCTLEGAEAFIKTINDGVAQNKWLYWAINLKEKPQLIGTICLWNFAVDKEMAETGYELNPAFQRMGIATEALTCVINYGFKTLGLVTLEAFTHKDNAGSCRLLEKHHFKIETERNYIDNVGYQMFLLRRKVYESNLP